MLELCFTCKSIQAFNDTINGKLCLCEKVPDSTKLRLIKGPKSNFPGVVHNWDEEQRWSRRVPRLVESSCWFTWEMVQKAWASTTLCLCHSTQIMNSSMVCDCLLSDRVADMVTHVLNLWSVVCAWPLTETTSATMPTVLVVCCKICHDPYV